MKNISKIFLIVIVGVLSSCSDFLDLQPTDRQTPESFYKTRDDAYAALIGAYEPITHQGFGDWHMIGLTLDIMSDDCYKGGYNYSDGGDGMYEVSKFTSLSSSGHIHTYWNKNYGGIARVNILLDRYDDIEFRASETSDKKNFKAEAQFLRAHYYLELVRFYENIPLFTYPVSASDWENTKQADVHDTYAQIAKDMLDAIEGLPSSYPASELGRFTVWAAKAELARAFLFYTGYYGKTTMPVVDGDDLTKEAVLGHLKDIINSGNFGLLNKFSDLFLEESNFCKEVVLDLPFTDKGPITWNASKPGNIQPAFTSPAIKANTSSLLGGGFGFSPVSHELLEHFETGDTRIDATIIKENRLLNEGAEFEYRFQHTGLFTYKYTLHPEISYEGDFRVSYPLNFHLIRYADVLLMAAELDNGTQGLVWLNEVRARAGLAPKSTINLDIVYDERRSEFAMEGIRYWDVLRRGVDYAYEKLTVLDYEVRPSDRNDKTVYEREFNITRKGFFPIPQYEMDLAKGLIQNDGY